MQGRALVAVGSVCALGAALAPAIGQQGPGVVALASPGAFQESFTPSGNRGFARASNRVVVGLHLGKAAGRLRLDDLAVSVPKTLAKGLCVKLTTRDARYWSLNGYKAPDPKAGAARLETSSKFIEELAGRYRAEDAAIRAVNTGACNEDADGPLLAVRPPGAVAQDVLVAFVNAVGARSAAKIIDKDGKTLATGACSLAPRDSALAYTESCEFSVSGFKPAAGQKLQVTLVGGSAGAPVTSDLQLPEN
jgi:hypothetical protein